MHRNGLSLSSNLLPVPYHDVTCSSFLRITNVSSPGVPGRGREFPFLDGFANM